MPGCFCRPPASASRWNFCDCLGRQAQVGGQHLQRHPPVEGHLLRFVHRAHAAGTDFPEQPEVPHLGEWLTGPGLAPHPAERPPGRAGTLDGPATRLPVGLGHVLQESIQVRGLSLVHPAQVVRNSLFDNFFRNGSLILGSHLDTPEILSKNQNRDRVRSIMRRVSSRLRTWNLEVQVPTISM